MAEEEEEEDVVVVVVVEGEEDEAFSGNVEAEATLELNKEFRSSTACAPAGTGRRLS